MSTVSLQLHATPAAGVDDPMALLAACHERVQRMLKLLQRLRSHLADKGADESARQAASDVMRYFDDAAPRHHDDEERHILPALRALGEHALAERLHRDHRVMSDAWSALRTMLLPLARDGVLPAAEFGAACRSFCQLYRDHVALEDQEAYPKAVATLSATALRTMAHDMAVRRGLPPPA